MNALRLLTVAAALTALSACGVDTSTNSAAPAGASGVATATGLDLKGLRLGAPLDCSRLNAEGSTYGEHCATAGDTGITRWTTTLLGQAAELFIKLDTGSGRVEFVHAEGSFGFDATREALAAKFGKPTCDQKDGMALCRWQDAQSFLVLADKGAATGRTIDLMSRSSVRAQGEAREKAASDI